MKKVSGGTPPDENVSKNTQKNVFRSIKIRKQISVKKYSEKHLPLQNPLERGGLGGAHLDKHFIIYSLHIELTQLIQAILNLLNGCNPVSCFNSFIVYWICSI